MYKTVDDSVKSFQSHNWDQKTDRKIKHVEIY